MELTSYEKMVVETARELYKNRQKISREIKDDADMRTECLIEAFNLVDAVLEISRDPANQSGNQRPHQRDD